MFTGLIESLGQVARLERRADGACRIEIATELAGELTAGDSLAVNGVCLTVMPTGDGVVKADIGPETMRVTTLGALAPGSPLNLERSMRADARFGGHFVQGHVDATGELVAVREDGDSHWLTFEFPEALAPMFVPKGSVAVDGISLTVADLRRSQFDVMIVPFTWQATNLSSKEIGTRVNLECDMIGKYVARAIELRRT